MKEKFHSGVQAAELVVSYAQTEAAREKRRDTIERRRQVQRQDILLLRRRGLVPLAIAETVGTTVTRVSDVLREEGFELPSYLTLTGPKPKKARCPKCGA
jgi:hypothetical protein